jgi:hypothetical protein
MPFPKTFTANVFTAVNEAPSSKQAEEFLRRVVREVAPKAPEGVDAKLAGSALRLLVQEALAAGWGIR